MCTSAVRKARVPAGIANRSRNPTSAASTAPTIPIPINHADPTTRATGSSSRCETTSKTRLAAQAPIGTVTRIGWNGCPYGPASTALTGSFALVGLAFTRHLHLVSPTHVGFIRDGGQGLQRSDLTGFFRCIVLALSWLCGDWGW